MLNTSLKITSLAVILSLGLMGCVKGPKGDQGTPGAGRIRTTINCSGIISGLAGVVGAALNGLEVEYDAALTTSGDVYATARIIDSAVQHTSTNFYAAGQAGAATADVLVVADYDFTSDGGWWKVSLNRSTMVTSITYTDSSLGGLSPVNLTFTPAACSVQNW